MAITQNHVINIQPGVSAPLVIHCSQGDTGTQINLTVVNGDEEFDCSSYACSVHGVRSDGGNWGPITCTVSGSTVCFSLTSAMTAVAGACLAEISVGTVGTANFAILVENATFGNGVTYSNDVSVYQNILNAVQAGLSLAEAAVTNEKNERIAAVNTEATARQTADNTLQGNINSEASTRASADSNLQSQINQIVAPSGEAPSAAEVQNARIGADGVTYDTLGTAIRSQFNDINETLDNFIDYKTTRNILNNNLELVSNKFQRIVNKGTAIINNNKTASSASFSMVTFKNVDKYDFIEIKDKIAATGFDVVAIYSKGTYIKDVNTPNGSIISTSGFDEVRINLSNNNLNSNGINIYSIKGDTNKIEGYEAIYGDAIKKGYTFYEENTNDGYEFDVTDYDEIKISGVTGYAYTNLYTLFDKYGNIVDFEMIFADKYDKSATVNTKYATKLILSTPSGTQIIYGGISYKKQLTGKSAVWFGTSIPWGGAKWYESYPFMCGEICGLKVYNESVPESEITSRYKSLVNDANPYGMSDNWNKNVKQLSATVNMIQWCIDNFNSDIFTKGSKPSVKPNSYEQLKLLSNSYEIKIARYLTNAKALYDEKYQYGNFVGDVDFYIFNHGHNDDMKYDGEFGFTNEFNKLCDFILKYNHNAKIIIIGEYECSTEHGIYIDSRLNGISEIRKVPYFKLYNSLGWTNVERDYLGHWVYNGNEYEWTDVNTIYKMNAINANIPDGIHPNSDPTLKATKMIAQACADFLTSI